MCVHCIVAHSQWNLLALVQMSLSFNNNRAVLNVFDCEIFIADNLQAIFSRINSVDQNVSVLKRFELDFKLNENCKLSLQIDLVNIRSIKY